MLAARIVALVAAVAVLLGVGVAYVFTDVLQANSGTSDADTPDSVVVTSADLPVMSRTLCH